MSAENQNTQSPVHAMGSACPFTVLVGDATRIALGCAEVAICTNACVSFVPEGCAWSITRQSRWTVPVSVGCDARFDSGKHDATCTCLPGNGSSGAFRLSCHHPCASTKTRSCG